MGDINSVAQKMLDAIQILTDSSIQKAKYDRTINAIIVSCEDKSAGKYKCKYQDAIFSAYAASADIGYSPNTEVYVLIPNGDMTNRKAIIGTVKSLGVDYVNDVIGDQAYEIIGNNALSDGQRNVFCLKSNNKNYHCKIYERGKKENLVAVNKTALEEYIKKSSSLIIGAKIRTDLPIERQNRGHYGIIFRLRFKDKAKNKEVVRPYVLSENQMTGNPYRLIHSTRQYKIFDIDGENFIALENIQIFNENFPNIKDTPQQVSSALISPTEKFVDIWFSNLELSGAIRFDQSDLNGVLINFVTPQGIYFTNEDAKDAVRPVQARIRAKGKLVAVDKKNQDVPFYWGMQDLRVNVTSAFYNPNLGSGWRCLNGKNITQKEQRNEKGEITQQEIFDWLPMGDTLEVMKSSVAAKELKYKVVVIYNGIAYSKQITLYNKSENLREVWITSSTGQTKFYFDRGHPTLTCHLKNADGKQVQNVPKWCESVWVEVTDKDVYKLLQQTTDENEDYLATVEKYNKLNEEIKNGVKFENAQKNEIKKLQNKIKSFEDIQRVQENQIIDLQVRNITNYSFFKCSLYNRQTQVCVGTGVIKILNITNTEDTYSLVINEGTETFKYNENGVAPNNKSLLIPQKINPLSFSIYNNLGEQIEDDITSLTDNCTIKWQIPIKNTLLIDINDTTKGKVTEDNPSYRVYENLFNFNYNIQQKYDVAKQNNQIKLTVEYKGMYLAATTNFTFAKQGQPGTNGTEYLVKIIPNAVTNAPLPLFPSITTFYNNGQTFILNYLLKSTLQNGNSGIKYINATLNESTLYINKSYDLFIAQLWKNGNLVWQGRNVGELALDGVTRPSAIKWSVLKNKYDKSDFEVTNENNGYIKFNGGFITHLDKPDQPRANTIKCQITYNDKIYYGTIPITVAHAGNANYRVGLKDYTGFRYAIYSDDGVYPQYDSSNPFEFYFKEYINNVWEDTSVIQKIDKKYMHTYKTKGIGTIQITSSGKDLKNSDNLIKLDNTKGRYKTEQPNQFWYMPSQKCSGECKNNAIYVLYYNGEETKYPAARAMIPVHFLLNKYGLAHLNEWDGNSIQLNDEGGYILAPQMGAGKKDKQNRFTGVLMGQVTRPVGNNKIDNIGLFGFAEGERSFFLNSQNGAAIFGRQGDSQISIDPTRGHGYIYSGNYWKNYDAKTGLPSSYNKSNRNEQGMMINLTDAYITWGSGNFEVNPAGHITAKGGGTIAGWNITDNLLYSYIKNGTDSFGTVGLNSKGPKNFNNNTDKNDIKMFWVGDLIDKNRQDALQNYNTGTYITYRGHVRFGDSFNNFFEFDPLADERNLQISVGKKGGTEGTFSVSDGLIKLGNWYVSDDLQDAHDCIFYYDGDIRNNASDIWESVIHGFRGDIARGQQEHEYYLWINWEDSEEMSLGVQGNGSVFVGTTHNGKVYLPPADRIYIGNETLASILEAIDSGGDDGGGSDPRPDPGDLPPANSSSGSGQTDSDDQGSFPDTGGQTGGDDATGPALGGG